MQTLGVICVMCQQYFAADKLDWCGRCPQCFRTYIEMDEDEKPNMGIPWSNKTPPGA